VIDASGSMAAWQRMRRTKAAAVALLHQAYQRRDRVAIVTFHGTGSEFVLPPVRGLHLARAALENLAVGGATPLAHGLAAVARMVRTEKRRRPGQPIWVVVMTDGRANAAMNGGDPWTDALTQASTLASCGADCLVVDTETGWPRFARAAELAEVMGARYVAADDVLGRRLADRWTRAV
jgi:magnesium chelatase subunit D